MKRPTERARSMKMFPLLPPLSDKTPSAEKTLEGLFMTLYLRGGATKSALHVEGLPVLLMLRRLKPTIISYGVLGLLALFLIGKPVLQFSAWLHVTTFFLLSMFITRGANDVLFNKEEADILLHRPVTAKALLWAKLSVLLKMALSIAAAANLAALIIGIFLPDGGWRFPFAHAVSTALEAVFCAGAVVLTYQLCIRWLGRDRLEGVLTTVQVLAMVAITVGSRMISPLLHELNGVSGVDASAWWMRLLPPFWFAGFDDAIAGQGSRSSWINAEIGVGVTTVIAWLAFVRLASTYKAGLHALTEVSVFKGKQRERLRWLKRMTLAPPLCWWLQDSVERASFLLVVAYLFRDRDVKLRVYPGVAPYVASSFMILLPSSAGTHFDFQEIISASVIGFAGSEICMMPLIAAGLVSASQQWKAAESFRTAPVAGPGAFCLGARMAVLLVLTSPLIAVLGVFALIGYGARGGFMLLPSLIALPVYSLIPYRRAAAVPLSKPVAMMQGGVGCVLFGVLMLAAFAVNALAMWSMYGGWFGYFILTEAAISYLICRTLKAALAQEQWKPAE